MKILDASIDYFHIIAEGQDAEPWDEWWGRNSEQLEAELPRGQFLRFRIKPFDEICTMLEQRGIGFTKSTRYVNIRASRFPLNHDPIESDPEVQPLFQAAHERVEQLLANEPRRMGFCHLFWRTKKQVLKEEYDIEWRTPAEMNPSVLFD